ncbi:MAG: VWA domain-containing protein [Chloroflexi bacterium AL-W]|nr:VWA domain-containing protein [Chloroflexi bacterium AL-N1]NOK70687.1 VWA domain-containing protein [Chloroflexi bacterium AL-N10]NOK78506.1 VWA domain-containing protein [Chloroflexi bacterium AL-N5]NOK85590.1 VWA domain-containing protein [Chloroflexi bacterium AL-W]NOK92504.1 VWA domain-containing protein [Chloroflexi bacterium AL-N15]
MQLSFIFPQLLWLLLVLPLLWLLTIALPQRIARWRLWSSLTLRTIILLGLILGLAGIQLVRPVETISTIFLLDVSDSVSLSQRARAEAFIQDALHDMPANSQSGVVVFGQRAQVERTLSDSRILGQMATQPGANATNIEDALQLGLSMLPAEGYQRLVLLSDGGENNGDAVAARQIAASRGIPIDVVSLSGLADGLDAQVSTVELPSTAREGQSLRMRIDLESNTETSGQLTVEGPGGLILVDQQVELSTELEQLEVVLPETQPAFNRYVVRLDVADDARIENNVAEAYSFVSGLPRVLLVEGQPDQAQNLANALTVTGNEVETIPPDQMPDNLGDLSYYDAVILINVARTTLSDRAVGTLSAYVHDLGRSLMMVGGQQSFGAGGWRDTPVEEVLPVTMDIPAQVQFPPVSIVVVIDTSGSMSTEEGGRTKLQLAAEGAQRIAAAMRPEDDLTVIPFDSVPGNVIGPIPGTRRDEAIDALSRVEPGGGGINIHDGLMEASRYIRQSENKVRHIITITDGSDTVQQEGAINIVRELNEDELTTLTSIAVGNGDHVPFIRSMARVGQGRTFLTDEASNIPSILAEEAEAVIQPYIVEETFTPQQGAIHPILRDVTEVPQLYGYVITTPRQSAQIILASLRGEPILAAWQHGLGRALVWTSDFRGQWGQEWVSWEEFPRFSAQMLSWLLPQQNEQNLTLQSSTVGDQLLLTANAQDSTGRAQTGLRLVGQLISSDGENIEVALQEVAPGKYRTSVGDARPGVYLAQIIAQDADGEPVGSVTAGAVMPRSIEYRSRGGNPALLEALYQDTNGRLDPEPGAVFDTGTTSQGATGEIAIPLLWMALWLFPVDIALRRLIFARYQVAAALQRVGLGRFAPPPALGMPRPVVITQPDQQPPNKHKQTAKDKRASWFPRPARQTKDQNLERLREAQEQARKRARGEE